MRGLTGAVRWLLLSLLLAGCAPGPAPYYACYAHRDRDGDGYLLCGPLRLPADHPGPAAPAVEP